MEKLENRLKNFLTNHTVDEINIDEVKKTFSNLKERTEEKYTLLHAIADESFPIEKAIKTIECFLKLGVNPNAQDIYGKYTFIHLAFYSNYPFSFFEKVIPLALEYNFNINSKDEDGDTIMHSAIYSEDYLDKIYPLFALLNDNFNLEAKNNLNKNLLEALKESIYEAKKIKNENWYNELISEEKEITTYLTNKYKFLEENREKIKEQQRILEEKRQYQNFLINFKKKLETCSTLQDAINLLELTEKIKEEDYKNETIKKLTSTIDSWNKIIDESKAKKSDLDKLLKQFPHSKVLVKQQKELEHYYDLNVLPIQTVTNITTSINETIEKQLDILVNDAAKRIHYALSTLNKVIPITTRDIHAEVKTKIKKLTDSTKEKKD